MPKPKNYKPEFAAATAPVDPSARSAETTRDQAGQLIGRHGVMLEEATEAERRAARKRYNHPTTPKKPLKGRQAEWCMSARSREVLAAARAKQKELGQDPRVSSHKIARGWGGKKRFKELVRIRTAAKEKARIIMDVLVEKGIITPSGDLDKDAAAKAALQFTVETVLGGDTIPRKDRLAAANTVLTYTMAKPETKSSVKVETAESFLASLLDDKPAE